MIKQEIRLYLYREMYIMLIHEDMEIVVRLILDIDNQAIPSCAKGAPQGGGSWQYPFL